MLVLSRKQNQSIVIDDNIKLQVLKITGNTVRIGIQAPNNVKILRGELAPYEVGANSQSIGELTSNSNGGLIEAKIEAKSAKSAKSIESVEAVEVEEPTMIEGLTFELEFDQDDLTNLPNPFAVAQVS